MAITLDNLKKIADLAYIDVHDAELLLHEANVVLAQIELLHQINTDVDPLLHPVNAHQTLRMDEVLNNNCVTELAKIAPLFVDNQYLVPSVIRGK
ncbi:MAG: Asp-tRNA(Asn)/Glu-tRNA(Gln) amidotransferase subunit GatC [Legionellaceae bacterium]|nr:Asp-tRNA(Asn)/Glu-tRNA(Gln) amidotransferase subunit GatC [Legionellaceae bacterium]